MKARSGRAFSLVEVLLAIVILGIGVISIAALFPAGIAQQRLSNDDFMGPVVANHAISVIRAKVRQDDFGTFEEFWNNEWPVTYPPGGYFSRTIAGDWGWMRPSVFLAMPTDANFQSISQGSIDIFSYFRTGQADTDSNLPDLNAPIASEHWVGWPNEPFAGADERIYGIPYNLDLYGATPPRILITQSERYYPHHSNLVEQAQDPARPQYVWDCMFRRYQGRVYVAVFVYRVSAPGAAATQPFAVQPRPGPGGARVPPLPIAIDLADPGDGWPAYLAPWDIRYDDNDRPLAEVRGFNRNEPFDLLAENQSWQAQRQWILDQNMNVHRVLANRREGNEMWIELTRPLTPVRLPYFGGFNDDEKYDNANDTTANIPWDPPFNNVKFPSDVPDEYFANPGDQPLGPDMLFPFFDRGVVTRFWYVPARMEYDLTGNGQPDGEYVLTPVYIAVKEL